MKFTWLSGKAETAAIRYESTRSVESETSPGVRFRIRRMSFARRIELCRQIREIAPKLEFLEASDDFSEKVQANLLGQEIESLYLRWGLAEVQGLLIDGQPVTPELLITNGPDALAKEIVAVIQHECGLSEAERKN